MIRRFTPFLFLLWLPWAGCSSVVDEPAVPVVLMKDVAFRFSFSSDQVNGGKLTIIPSVATADLQNDLDGYAKSDIQAARVTLVEMKYTGQASVGLDAIVSEALLQLTEGTTGLTVARLALKPTGRSVLLAPEASANVADLLKGKPFGAVLELRAPPGIPGDDYDLETRVTFEIEVK